MSSGGTIFGSQGSQLVIPANAFTLNGTAVTGNVDIEFVEIYDRASMLLNNMPTTGKRSNGDEEALKSKGEFFINAKQNGTQLDIATPIQLQSAILEGETFGTVEPMQALKLVMIYKIPMFGKKFKMLVENQWVLNLASV